MKNKTYKFNRWWLTGFTQAEGSFVVSFEPRKKGRLPLYPRFAFVYTQNVKEAEISKSLQEFLGVGPFTIVEMR